MSDNFRPTLRTLYDGPRRLHPDLLVQFEADKEPVLCCGDSWCHGACDLPALVIPAEGDRREMKAYSSMTACGPVMQSWRLEWKGSRLEVPPEHWADFLKRMWL